MEFRILGPLEVEENGKQLAPSGQKARALLALLLLRANEPVTSDRLVEEIWGDDLPANSAKTLQIQISRLRKSLGADRLETVGGGYALVVAEGELDRDRAVSLVERGDRSLAQGEADAAGRCFREALSLFNGRPLGEFAYERFAQAELARLEELEVQAREGLIEAELALGRGPQVTGDLEALVAAHPLRERLHGQRMLALYQAGRQAEALDAYQEARRRFVDELGLEPGRALQELEQRI
ncbi:MAG: AfsR/SARP family transcriptional regulator, partial [Actinomycetota bacterium]|nr:AfsR/SARP family transcriptional regulator [Actinomycetota bacterium]